ncbi:ubiquinol-cytochrome c reductase cytochrome c1 subunit [Palleronia marisminoris]|uniref:Cytochrome c1 n=1 Tax=Palleronia marisminoris TaxID=315423 RepID=A0A1Y5TMB1_9RHOB|nr:cytochrome c1 [Palleronia marisminoris]SFH44162.1 ubiquinol-cytochrome c reductase cytochrome c1 subunit [Palleronia marisminoris]SLN67251.1 Cytochrome c1 precursor [Palleronia marisminoris]
MIKQLTLSLAVALGLAGAAHAAGSEDSHVTDYAFPFEGPFGTYDQFQLQRGLQVYTQVCSACHGLQYVAFRSLGAEDGPGLPEDQVRAYAAQFEVWDEALLDGEGDFRPAIPTDHFPESALSNAPDLSLMGKARAGFHGPYGLGINQLVKGMGGAEYLTSLLMGYTGETMTQAGATLYENETFPGGWIAMPQPLYGDDVVYEDGTEATLEQVSKDVSAFMMWTAEPKLAARKRAGLTGVVILSVLAVLLYLTNKRIWAPHKRKIKDEPAA